MEKDSNPACAPTNPSDALDKLQLKRYCCRRMVLTHVDLIEKLLLYNREWSSPSFRPLHCPLALFVASSHLSFSCLMRANNSPGPRDGPRLDLYLHVSTLDSISPLATLLVSTQHPVRARTPSAISRDSPGLDAHSLPSSKLFSHAHPNGQARILWDVKCKAGGKAGSGPDEE